MWPTRKEQLREICVVFDGVILVSIMYYIPSVHNNIPYSDKIYIIRSHYGNMFRP